MTNNMVLTIGSYDGVHKGHLQIISELKKISYSLNLKSALVYFPIPPKFVIANKIENSLITTSLERKEIIKETGIDEVYELNFTRDIYLMSASDFFNNFIINKYKAKALVVGRDFAVGYNRAGDTDFLKKMCEKNGILFKVIDYFKVNGHKVSSSLIRNMLSTGKVSDASDLLSRYYFVNGIVVKGAGMGRKLGYPTANLDVDKYKILPRGVYTSRVLIDGIYYNAVSFIGHRYTLGTLGLKLIMETHILDFDMDIYGKNLKVFFISKIRDEIKFKNSSELIEKIRDDILKAKFFLETI
jgi:riboflavin kinase/FMN adenylyltransferase